MQDAQKTSSPDKSPVAAAADRFAYWLVPIIYGVSAFAFIGDLLRVNMPCYGIIYTALVATAVFHKSRSGLWILSAIATAMVVVGGVSPAIGPDMLDTIGNRILSILAILATASFVHHARDTQERLSDETRRAEAAERLQMDVLTNLSQEIRTPLHALLGIISLTIATSRPEHREALCRVRCDGKQLLATIDNLLDLTQIGERRLRRQTIDIAMVAQDAAEAARMAANERQIRIAIVPDDGAGRSAVIGDSWAMRRILDNLLANAVRLTPPGGTISLSVGRTAGTVTASVSDTGKGLPPELTQDLRADAPDIDGDILPATGGTGLVLSRHLARAMNGRLTASNQPGPGATVILSLPAADKQAA